MRFTVVLAVFVTALALYVSRGVLDQVLTADGPVRVALLPPLLSFGGFLSMTALGLLWLDRRTARGTNASRRLPLAPLLLPLFGAAILILPYLPIVADFVPALQMIAGPLAGVIWVAIVTQLIWVLYQRRIVRADWLQRWTLRRSASAIAVLTLLASGAAASRLTGTVLFPAGDEPHYLIIAQSLWRDRDLKIENNHQRRDYAEYFPVDLEPHYLTRGADGEIYSIHPVGMPVLIAPVLGLGGYRTVVLLFVMMAAAAAGLMWHAVVRATNAAGAATFACLAVVCTTPFLFNSFAVYPEIPAALSVVIALTMTFGGAGPQAEVTRWLVVGLACAALPWLSTKYAPMSAALVAIGLTRILWPRPLAGATAIGRDTRASRAWPGVPLSRGAPALAALVLPYAASLVAWFAFFYAIWGSPWPQAPYGDLVQTSPRNLIFGAPGLLFDQEYGLLPYAPVYILAFTGLAVMWREGGDMRRRAVEIAVVFAALAGTVGAFRIWWGGSASPGRPLTSGLLLLAFPMAMAFRRAAAGSTQRAAQHLLLWLSIGVAGVMLFAQQGLLLNNGRDGTSALLEYLSPRWAAWTAAPSFIHHEASLAWLYVFVWLLLAAIAAWAIARSRASHPGSASLQAMLTLLLAVVVASIAVPRLPATPTWPSIDLRSRPRLPLLDAFDTVARPLGVEYRPFVPVSAAELPPHASLSVEPDVRLDPQPIRVLHNGRFSLPAGHYRVEVEWVGQRHGETIGLQLGTTGEPWRTWPVDPRPGERWTTEFSVPLDVGFVGLRGTPELERTIGRIAIVPLAVVNATDRPRLPPVVAASSAHNASFFYYNGNGFPESRGFWVRGGRRTQVTVERPAFNGETLLVRVHSGLIDNRLEIALPGWRESIDLKREQPRDIEIPSSARRLVTMEVAAEATFVPFEIEAGSLDKRPLGVWIEVVR